MLTAHQKQQRKSGIGASECAIAPGLNPYAKPIDLYNMKVFDLEQPESPKMRLGNYFEAGVVAMYEVELGGGVVRDPAVKIKKCRTRRHPDEPWMLATVDREVYRHGVRERLAEVKLVSSRYQYNPETGQRELVWGYAPDEIPAYVQCQVQWQFAVTGESRGDVVACFLDTGELAIYPQIRNDKLIYALMQINRDFWFDHIVAREPPTIDGSPGSSVYLRKAYPQNYVNALLAADALYPQAAEAARCYAKLCETEKLVADAKEEYGNLFKNWINIHDGMIGRWGSATWKRDSKGPIDYKKLAGVYRTRLELVAGASADAEVAALGADLDAIEEACRDEPRRPLRLTYKLPLGDRDDDDDDDEIVTPAPSPPHKPRPLLTVYEGGQK